MVQSSNLVRFNALLDKRLSPGSSDRYVPWFAVGPANGAGRLSANGFEALGR